MDVPICRNSPSSSIWLQSIQTILPACKPPKPHTFSPFRFTARLVIMDIFKHFTFLQYFSAARRHYNMGRRLTSFEDASSMNRTASPYTVNFQKLKDVKIINRLLVDCADDFYVAAFRHLLERRYRPSVPAADSRSPAPRRPMEFCI